MCAYQGMNLILESFALVYETMCSSLVLPYTCSWYSHGFRCCGFITKIYKERESQVVHRRFQGAFLALFLAVLISAQVCCFLPWSSRSLLLHAVVRRGACAVSLVFPRLTKASGMTINDVACMRMQLMANLSLFHRPTNALLHDHHACSLKISIWTSHMFGTGGPSTRNMRAICNDIDICKQETKERFALPPANIHLSLLLPSCIPVLL